ncbi:ROP-interactive CRIB motif-containing protein 5 [Rhynchospora pubera]|uniref:ROP-interactive CRIB motif-containing protein 5 n=1 Tax=Rhynchospora pubera TaxID=906938 RepID=A0AAV8GR68_9POAL|nr:ROP-interactive CRIB motif-containing protein 5 [Rhynchospora pubera]
MGAIMKKNILRPIQFISKIFDAKEEEELQIGLPTDVKHLAHIGFHGPETTGPSWMDQYHSAPLEMQGSEHTDAGANQWASQEINFEIDESPLDTPSHSPKPMRPRHSRRHQSEGTITVDKESKKKGHRLIRKKKEGSKEDSAVTPDKPAVPKSKKKKSKGSEGVSESSGPRRREAAVAPEEGGIRTDGAASPLAVEIGLS